MGSTASGFAESVLLCEGCGYALTGLPADSNCPECGKPMAESSGENRTPTAWERGTGWRKLSGFVTTSARVLFAPARFYKTLVTRVVDDPSSHFAQIHWTTCALLLSITTQAHSLILGNQWPLWFILVTWPLIYALLWLTTYYAGRLTAWEANYRGLRLPRQVIMRALHFHTPHVLVVCVVAANTVVLYAGLYLNHIVLPDTVTIYLFVLCGEVVVGALYLFRTYWIGMRNIMFANR